MAGRGRLAGLLRWAVSTVLAAALATALGAALAAPAVAAVRGEAARHFRAGIEAADAGDWRRVAAEMSRALAVEPAVGARVKIYGMRFEVYVPHYWLGMAQDELGDCAAALASFDAVLSLPELEDLLAPDQLGRLDERAGRCRGQVAAEADAVLDTSDRGARRGGPAPPFLRRAAANYLAGDYEAVTAALEALETLTADPRAVGTGLLLRGAARFALHRRADPPEPALLELARRDLADFRRLEPARRPSDFWFSPDFLELYDQAD